MSEHAVSLYSARWIGVTPSDLTGGGEMDKISAEIAERCHIYLVCRRPACSFDPSTFKYDGKNLIGTLVYKLAGETHAVPFDYPFKLLDGATSVRLAPYPHREVQTFTPNGNLVRHLPASYLATAKAADDALRHLEVLYVGQAYAEGNRSAIVRLQSHSTLQKILADVVQKAPDDEILLLTFEYLPYRVITSMDGTDKNAIRDDSDHERFISIIDNPLTEHQQICLVEAALIRYFAPKYNEIYKASFPAADQKILSSCYELDFSGLIVEIDTEELSLPLYSKTVAAACHHIAKFNLIDPNARRSFFTFGEGEEWPGVISPTS
jgi:hypothetical protein